MKSTLTAAVALLALTASAAVAQTGTLQGAPGPVDRSPGPAPVGVPGQVNPAPDPNLLNVPDLGGQNPAPAARRSPDLPAGDFANYGDTVELQEFALPPDVLAQLRAQRGPEQRPLELVQTYLLNQFGQLGFAALGDMQKVGETYVASVQTVDGQWARVVIDPAAGTLVAQRPAAGNQAAMTGATGAPDTAAGSAGAGPTLVAPAPGATVGGPTAAPGISAGPLTGVPGGDQATAAACTETELERARDWIEQVPESLQASARIIWQHADEYQDENNLMLCAQKLQELQALAQSGIGGPATVAAQPADPGLPRAVAVTPGAVPAECTEAELTRVSDMISQAPPSVQGVLRQKLQTADEFQDDNQLQLCANTLREIVLALQGPTGPAEPTAEATPGVILSPQGTPVAASECTETELTRVSDLISQAPEAIQPTLRQRLQRADNYQDDNNLQLCAQSLAEIRNIIENVVPGQVATPQ